MKYIQKTLGAFSMILMISTFAHTTPNDFEGGDLQKSKASNPTYLHHTLKGNKSQILTNDQVNNDRFLRLVKSCVSVGKISNHRLTEDQGWELVKSWAQVNLLCGANALLTAYQLYAGYSGITVMAECAKATLSYISKSIMQSHLEEVREKKLFSQAYINVFDYAVLDPQNTHMKFVLFNLVIGQFFPREFASVLNAYLFVNFWTNLLVYNQTIGKGIYFPNVPADTNVIKMKFPSV